ncbi:MAG: hypothetical protein HFJ37_02030 [Clostridia bacterium]|nr:hypothetical protein [Clostridia bacterium]
MLPYDDKFSIYETKELAKLIEHVGKKLLQQAHKMKVIQKFSKQEEMDYELLKNIFYRRNINLEEIYIKLTKEKENFFLYIGDGDSLEEKIEVKQKFNKKDLEIRFNKKVKAFY